MQTCEGLTLSMQALCQLAEIVFAIYLRAVCVINTGALQLFDAEIL
jgi:hypothetical protein